MSDYSDAKSNIGGLYPANVVTADYERLEPILTVAQLKTRFLLGIPLVSQMKDPITGKNVVLHDSELKDIIDGAIQRCEHDLYIDIYAVERKERYPFDYPAFQQYGFMRTEHCPIWKMSAMTITAPNDVNVYSVPLEWVSPAYFLKGQVNIVPWLASSQSVLGTGPTGQGTSAGGYFLSILSSNLQSPAYWQIIYTSGFPEGMVPRVVNDIVGMTAAIDILSMLGATYSRVGSMSLSLDGMSQSMGLNPNIFAVRITDLKEQLAKYTGKVKAMFGKKLSVGTI